jgi:hypothetical protein
MKQRLITAALAILSLLAIAGGWVATEPKQQDAVERVRPFPRCAENSTIVGRGEFDEGYWEWYECGPTLDDYCSDAELLYNPETSELHIDCHQRGFGG